ncbi:unnamed protein product [Peronospora destructor]|uniref:Ferric oxidoreductase domain-containing protein n=1 Tax=Peronospora destructor TaxID=86335 RepID=A0AAV0UDS5_9STRA|nr:unnamed protein product [Peronospora destructor]
MERRRTVTVPLHSPENDADLDLLLDQEEPNEIELNCLLASRTPSKRNGMRFLPKAEKTAGLEVLSTPFCNRIAKGFLHFCIVWMFFALLWIRWPIYYRTVFPSVETRVGQKMEVEPVVVSFALVLPFLFAGTIFYWKQDTVGSLAEWGQQLKLVTWLKAHPNIGKRAGFDAIDVVVVGGFLLLQLNLVIGKLMADKESGKLAKAGYCIRTGHAFGMNGLYAMVLSVILVARESFLHKFFGLSGERAARYHVLTGQFGLVMLLLHGVLYTGTWYKEGKVEQMLFPCLEETCLPKQRYRSIRNCFGAIAMATTVNCCHFVNRVGATSVFSTFYSVALFQCIVRIFYDPALLCRLVLDGTSNCTVWYLPNGIGFWTWKGKCRVSNCNE